MTFRHLLCVFGLCSALVGFVAGGRNWAALAAEPPPVPEPMHKIIKKLSKGKCDQVQCVVDQQQQSVVTVHRCFEGATSCIEWLITNPSDPLSPLGECAVRCTTAVAQDFTCATVMCTPATGEPISVSFKCFEGAGTCRLIVDAKCDTSCFGRQELRKCDFVLCDPGEGRSPVTIERCFEGDHQCVEKLFPDCGSDCYPSAKPKPPADSEEAGPK